MKLISLLDRLAATPGTAAPAPRRALLAQLGRAAVAALPLSVAAALPAAAAPADTSFDAVTQLLQLERTQVALYTQGLAVPGLIPTAQTADFQRLLAHQTQHTALIIKSLEGGGALVAALPRFDFSGKHGVATNPELFPSVLTNYDAFLALTQQLEDLGVRLYKTHAFTIGDPQLLRAALRIHAVEAEHSAHIRGLRKDRGAVVQSWPSEEDTAIARPTAALALTTAATGGEETGVQYVTPGVPVPFASFLIISTNTAIHDPALAEAFDEPVSSAAAQAALNLFV